MGLNMMTVNKSPEISNKINYLVSYGNDYSEDNVPIITLEVLSDNDNAEEHNRQQVENAQIKTESIDDINVQNNYTIENETGESELNDDGKDCKSKRGLLEYTTKEDGSVICRLCGEILQTRTHWYRHKYRVHVIQPWQTTPLFQCETCRVYFKSRKGYLGHIASRHSELHADCQPVLFNAQVKITTKQNNLEHDEEMSNKDPELAIPKSTVPTSNAVSVISGNKMKNKNPELRKCNKSSNSGASFISSWEEQRSQEEKLVADIIDRVKRECEAQGSGGPARRGYSRKPTIINS